MLSDIVVLFLAVAGVVFILFSIIFKLLIWKGNDVVISIPLNSDDKELFDKIVNLWEICSFLGIQKLCTIAIVNYGASEVFLNELKEYFSDYSFVRFIDKENLIKELHT